MATLGQRGSTLAVLQLQDKAYMICSYVCGHPVTVQCKHYGSVCRECDLHLVRKLRAGEGCAFLFLVLFACACVRAHVLTCVCVCVCVCIHVGVCGFCL